jgi:hypothetical protein
VHALHEIIGEPAHGGHSGLIEFCQLLIRERGDCLCILLETLEGCAGRYSCVFEVFQFWLPFCGSCFPRLSGNLALYITTFDIRWPSAGFALHVGADRLVSIGIRRIAWRDASLGSGDFVPADKCTGFRRGGQHEMFSCKFGSRQRSELRESIRADCQPDSSRSELFPVRVSHYGDAGNFAVARGSCER